MPKDDSINELDVARMTVFKAGADLANIVNEAGLISIREGRFKISQNDLVQAIQRVSFGMSYSGHVLTMNYSTLLAMKLDMP